MENVAQTEAAAETEGPGNGQGGLSRRLSVNPERRRGRERHCRERPDLTQPCTWLTICRPRTMGRK